MGANISSMRRMRRSNKPNYFGGNIDDDEIDRIQVQHHYAREAWNGNFSSPVKDLLKAGGATVLDVGCGPGTFLCEMAADYPKAYYVGVDLYSVYPDTKPCNVNFIQCDFLKGLPFKENTFDFVYIRFLIFEFTEFDWENFIVKEVTRVLKPNGWIEICEPILELNNQGPTAEKVVKAIQARARSFNINPYLAQRFKEFMNSNNLKNIQYQIRELPCGKWGGKFGELGAMFMHDAFKRHLKFVDIRSNDYDIILNDFLKEIDVYHTYFEFIRCFGQKC